MVFLKAHSWTSVGFNYIVAAWALQIYILFSGFWVNVCAYYNGEDHFKKIEIDITMITMADFAAGSCLIAFGVILGKCSLLQLWVLATIQVCFYALNEAIVFTIFKASDIGGSMTIHTFGAYYGLAASFFFQPRKATESKHLGTNYSSNLVAVIGTIFLFMYWPSFNAATGVTAV